MNRLAFDTSTAACSVAVETNNGEVVEIRPPSARLLEKPAHTTELLPAILDLAERVGLELAAIDQVIVGVGPGAFTGLRIGVATARAIATAANIRLVGVSSLAAMSGTGGATPVIDARRGELYFRVGGTDRLAEVDAAVEEIARAGAAAIGDGAIKLREPLESAGVTVPADDDPVHVVSAARLLGLAVDATPGEPGSIVPNYIRPPDAKVSSRESWIAGSTR